MAFRYSRRVEFAETDMAGIVHFAVFFRYMEEAEHALWRKAGLTIAKAHEDVGWPRVSAKCDFKAPLHFQDEFDVYVTMGKVTRSTITWECRFMRGDQVIGEGSSTTVHVDKKPGDALKSKPIPQHILDALRAAAE
jgi:YbgC/YbaW family acyl-CoA thioester hydrolase